MRRILALLVLLVPCFAAAQPATVTVTVNLYDFTAAVCDGTTAGCRTTYGAASKCCSVEAEDAGDPASSGSGYVIGSGQYRVYANGSGVATLTLTRSRNYTFRIYGLDGKLVRGFPEVRTVGSINAEYTTLSRVSGGPAPIGQTITVQEDGVTEGAVNTIDFTTNMNLSVSGLIATVSSTGGGGGSLDVEEGDTLRVTAATVLDFGAGFDVTESPSGEANIVLDYTEDPVILGSETSGNYAAGDAPAGNATGVACTDCVALTTETSGNYVASVATSSPLTGGAAGSEGAALTLGLDQSAVDHGSLGGLTDDDHARYLNTAANDTFSSTIWGITADTSDGSDTKQIRINAGGSTGASRGAGIDLAGNEHSGDGSALIHGGSDSGSHIDVQTNNSSAVIRLSARTNSGGSNANTLEISTGGVGVGGWLFTAGDGDEVTLGAGIDLIFEGATDDAFEGTLTVTDPTADRTWTLPNATGEISLLGQTIGTSEVESGITLDTEWDTAAEINAATTDADFSTLTGAETFATGTKTVTAKFDFGGGTLEIPNSTTLPGTCAVGDLYMDTDATSGQRIYACESTNTWVLQGDGGGGGGEANTASNLGGGLANFDSKSGVDLRFNTFSATDFDLATNVITVDAALTRDAEWDTLAEINSATTDDDALSLTGAQTLSGSTKTVTSKFDFGGGTLEIPNGITLPATCAVGDAFMDTDATSGQRFYLCQSTDTWALQGDGGGGGSLTVEEADASPSVGSVTKIQFDQADGFTVTDETGGQVQIDWTPQANQITLATHTTGSYVADLTGGDGIVVSGGGSENATITVETKSDEPGFLEDLELVDLTCGIGTAGKIAVNDADSLQYCDGAATPARRTVAYGTDAGAALTGDSATAFFTVGQIEAARGGTGVDTSASTGVLRVSSGTWTANAGVSHLAASTSADLAGVLSDESGSGAAVFGTSPTISGATASGTWTVTGTLNLDSGSEGTLRLPASTTLPATCTIGDTYWDTDADTDGSLYVCRAANTWKEVDDDGGAGGAKPPREVYYDAASFYTTEANFCPLEELDNATVDTLARACDDTTEEYMNGKFHVPSDVNTGGTVTFRAYVQPKTAAASTNCGLTFGHRALNDNEALNGSYTDLDSGAKALTSTSGNITEVEWTETVTNLGWAASDIVIFRLSRDPAVANDLTGDLYVLSLTVEIPRS